VLGQCSSLAVLNLAGNHIGEEGARSLAKVLGQCSSLSVLTLSVSEQNTFMLAQRAEMAICIKVTLQDGGFEQYKIKGSTELKRLMDAYCSRHGFLMEQIIFYFSGHRLHQTQTPHELGMQENDVIEAQVVVTHAALKQFEERVANLVQERVANLEADLKERLRLVLEAGFNATVAKNNTVQEMEAGLADLPSVDALAGSRDVPQWLRAVMKPEEIAQLSSSMGQQRVDEVDLEFFNDEALKEAGIGSAISRAKILRQIRDHFLG
jgi:small ubiquitin-related modifier